MQETRTLDFAMPSMSGTSTAPPPCSVMIPPARIASLWDGALHTRLKRAPLEAFLRNNSQLASGEAQDPLIESLELACLFIIDPALPHRTNWSALFLSEYFDALGYAILGISGGLGLFVQDSKLRRVAALRTMGRILTPVLGIDMASSTTAASIAAAGFPRKDMAPFDKMLGESTVIAVMSGTVNDLEELRDLVHEHLRSAVENGAAKILTAPLLVTISAAPPSNH